MHLKGTKSCDVRLFYRAQVNTFQLAVCSLPGDRLGKRRSLVADLGTFHLSLLYIRIFAVSCDNYAFYQIIETLKREGIQDIYVLCTEQELQW